MGEDDVMEVQDAIHKGKGKLWSQELVKGVYKCTMQVTCVKHRSYTDESFITFMQFWVQSMSKEKLSGALTVPDVDNLIKTSL